MKGRLVAVKRGDEIGRKERRCNDVLGKKSG